MAKAIGADGLMIAPRIDLRLDEEQASFRDGMADAERPSPFVAVMLGAKHDRRIWLEDKSLERGGRPEQPVAVEILPAGRRRGQAIEAWPQLRRSRTGLFTRLTQAVLGDARRNAQLVARHQESTGVATILVIILGY